MKKMDVHLVGLGNLGSAFLNGLKGLDANIFLYEESNDVRQSIHCLLYTSDAADD